MMNSLILYGKFVDIQVGAEQLPSLYGGLCKCKASCVYSEKGPWNKHENTINFAEAEDDNEFNFKGDDDDDEDLIDRGEIDGLRCALKSKFLIIINADMPGVKGG